MSYSKASDLLRVADMAMAGFEGVSLHEISQEFGCDHRTAQRMMRAFEAVFPQVDIAMDADRRRRWHMPRSDPRWLQAQGIRDSELAALEMAAERAERDGAPDDAQRLRALRIGFWRQCPAATQGEQKPMRRRFSKPRDLPRAPAPAWSPT